MKKVAVVVAGVVLAAGPSACGGGGGDEGEGATPVSLSGATTNRGTKTASESVEVELDDFHFKPTFIRAKAGQKLEIELKNEGQAVHTFTSPELGDIDAQLAAGASTTITVTVPQNGHVVFVCRFHRGQGMQGALFVG